MTEQKAVKCTNGSGFGFVALVALIALMAGNVASAETLGLVGPSCAWSDASWTNSSGTAATPATGDTVVIYDKTLTVVDADMSAVSALALMTGDSTGSVVFNIAGAASLAGKVSGVELVKQGDGELALQDVTQYGYNVDISVEKGILTMPVTSSTATFNCGALAVADGGTLVLPRPTAGNITFHCSRLDCAGVVTNASASYLTFYQNAATPEKPGVITGSIGGSFRFYQTTPLVFSNATSTCKTMFRPSSGAYATSVRNSVGLVKIGKTTDEQSSIGSISVIGAQGNGVLYRYLGEEEEETDKKYHFSYIGTPLHEYLNGWDAGAFGGITFKGQWAQGVWNNASLVVGATTQQPLLLTGENTAHPCVLANDLDIGPAYILKRGSGIWRFNDTSGKKNDGVIDVEEGTIQFESIDDAGRVCSLGLSTNLYGKYVGAFDATKKVPYAFALGSADHEGIMEFVGEITNAAVSTTRPFALMGDGRIVNAGNRRLGLGGFGPGSEGAKTLTLGGSRADCGVIYDITGNVSVVKTGGGGWTLGGNQRFTGALRVEAGVLTVSNPTNYTWFRFKVLESKQYHDYAAGIITTAPYAHQQTFEEFALYDAQGVRQNLGMTYPDHVSHPTAASSDYVSGYYAELPAGQLAPGREGFWYYYRYDVYSLNALCNDTLDVVSNTRRPFMSWYSDSSSLTTCPALTRPEKALPIVMHLPAGAGEIRSYDFVASSANSPYSFSLEGSKDGLAWDMLHCVTNYAGFPAIDFWYSDGTEFAPGQTRTGFTIAAAPTCTLLDNVSSVSVAAGATLRAEGEISPIRSITIDADAGMGTIDGFKYASEGGTLSVVNVEPAESVSLPGAYAGDGGTLSNIAAWDLFINGKRTSAYAIAVENSALRLVRHGFSLLIR